MAQPEHLRRRLMQFGAAVTVFGALHHLDHIARGNHVGWPLTAALTPFTPSLLIYALLLPGIYLTARGRVGPRYWAWTAAALLVLVVSVHFNPDPRSESWQDIYMPYAVPRAYCGPTTPVDPPAAGASWLCDPPLASAQPWLGLLALMNLAVLLGALTALLVLAVRGWWAQRRHAVTI